MPAQRHLAGGRKPAQRKAGPSGQRRHKARLGQVHLGRNLLQLSVTVGVRRFVHAHAGRIAGKGPPGKRIHDKDALLARLVVPALALHRPSPLRVDVKLTGTDLRLFLYFPFFSPSLLGSRP